METNRTSGPRTGRLRAPWHLGLSGQLVLRSATFQNAFQNEEPVPHARAGNVAAQGSHVTATGSGAAPPGAIVRYPWMSRFVSPASFAHRTASAYSARVSGRAMAG